MTTPPVETANGAVRGDEDDGIRVFRGIPYGQGTTGDRRFLPARAPSPWRGIRECLSYGPSCPQITGEQMGTPVPIEAEPYLGVHARERSVSEDCLVLNVWTPSLEPSANLPVLVWLHGGALSIGSASWPLYDFTNFARNHRAVIVGVNHRLGILGFLDLSGLDEDFADSGNVGMLDVTTALEWVRSNIAGFGGNPSNVTVFGESGGGMKTTTLLAMPSARDLFHKAAPMSGVLHKFMTKERAAENTEFVLQHVGAGPDVRQLQKLDATQLIEAEAALQASGPSLLGRRRAFAPVLGSSIPHHLEQAVRTGSAASVPIMSGCTEHEMFPFLMFEPELWTMSEQRLHEYISEYVGEYATTLLNRYQRALPGDSNASLLITLATDAVFRLPHVKLADAQVKADGAPTWMYSFAWGQPDPTGQVRASHGLDMPYFFDNVAKASLADGPDAQALVTSMSGALAAFARTGDPNHEHLPAWPRYNTDSRPYMRFDAQPRLEYDLVAAQRECWSDIPLAGFA